MLEDGILNLTNWLGNVILPTLAGLFFAIAIVRFVGPGQHQNWMYAGLVAGLFLLALVPLLVGAWSLPLLMVYLQLPIYLFHQVEEHHGDRFRQFVNDNIAGGLPALTTPAVVFINVPGSGASTCWRSIWRASAISGSA